MGIDTRGRTCAALFLLLALAVVGPVAPAAAEPLEPQATTSLRSKADAFTSSAQPGSNFGGDGRLFVGWRAPYEATRSLIRFDMSDLSKKEAVTGATLRLYVREAGPLNDPGRDIVVRRVTADWSEGGVTWSGFPGVDDRRWASESLGTSGGWRDWGGLKDLVRRWRLPQWQRDHYSNHGVYIQGYEADGSYRAFDSREGGNHPELRIEHVTDVWPPISAMNPLPQYVHLGSPEARPPDEALLKLAWTGSDPDPWTGIEFFRVYAQRNDGPFVLAFDEVQGLAKDFRATNGGVYRFNVYAVDQAGNVEPAKAPEAQTHVDLTPPTVSVQPLPQYVKGPFTLSWQGADGPTGADLVPSGLVGYNVYFRLNGGEWQPTALGVTETSKLFDDPLVDNAVYEFTAGAYDGAGNLYAPTEPQARTQLDRLAPVVTFEPVSGVTGQLFTVRWNGDDFGGSGVVSYDVQYRVNRQPWVDFVQGTTETQRLFEGTYSNTYSFRGRARDAAGNVGVYPDRAQLVVGVIDPGIWVSRALLPWTSLGR